MPVRLGLSPEDEVARLEDERVCARSGVARRLPRLAVTIRFVRTNRCVWD
jgi:hypothetical protein